MTTRHPNPFTTTRLRPAPPWQPWQHAAWHHLTQLHPEYLPRAADAPTWSDLLLVLPPEASRWLTQHAPTP